MKNRVLALFLAAAMALSVTACAGKEKNKEVPTVTVSGILPTYGDVIIETAYIGSVEPQQSITVYPMVSGNVTELKAALRNSVKKGDVLFLVDNTQASQALAEAEKELQTVKQKAEEARKEAERAEKEAETAKKEAEAEKLKTLQEKVNTAKTAMDAAKRHWDDLERALDDLEEQLEDVEDGKVSMSEYQKGRLEDKIEAKEKECTEAEKKYNAAVTDYQTALKTYNDAKKTDSASGTMTSQNKTDDKTSADKTTENIKTIYDEEVKEAEQKVKEAQERLNMYQVKAPFDGVIEAVYIQANEKVFEDSPCVVVSNISNMEVTFQVPESVAKSLHTGEAVRVEKDGGMNEALITEVGVMADPETKLFTVKASLGNVSGFSTGTTVSVYAETQKALDVMKIPYDALYFQSGTAYVYCIEDDEAVRREVQVGLMNEQSAEILEGLGEYDVVISTWSSQLKDGAEVELLFVIGYEERLTETPTAEPTEEPTEEESIDAGEEEVHKWVLPDWQ